MTKKQYLFFIKTQKLYKVNDKMEIKGGYFCTKSDAKKVIYAYIVCFMVLLSVKKNFLVVTDMIFLENGVQMHKKRVDKKL